MRPLWTQALPAAPRGLALAREKGWILAWDEANWFTLLNQKGERQAQVRAPGSITAACCADDGSAGAGAGARGEVWWLAPDLTVRWERSVDAPAVSAGLDAFGQYLAVSDRGGHVHVFDRLGRPVSRVQCPRPLCHLSFTPTGFVGSADYGLVASFDLSGRWLWRDGPVAHLGSLAVSGDGSQVALACFSEGILRYDGQGKKLGRLPVPEPCRLVAMSYDGRLLLVGGLAGRLLLLETSGGTLVNDLLDRPLAALALAALGDSAVVALADGPVMRMSLKKG
jgi:hypothetical protein